MRTFPLVAACLAAAVLAGCSSTPTGSAALQVQVVLAAGTQSRCVKVVADEGSLHRESKAIPTGGRSTLVAAVYQDDFAGPVQLQALGFSDEACTTRTVPLEESERAEGSFTWPVSSVTLTIRVQPADAGVDAGVDAGADAGVDAGVDAGLDAGLDDAGTQEDAGTDAGVDLDGDGFSPPLDCNDNDATIHPDAGERCLGAVDDNCNGLSDCADPLCLNQGCGTGGTCSAGGQCLAPVETGLCGDGIDNDLDTLVDCADPDCPAGVSCSDVNACTVADVCGGGDAGCVPGSDLLCQAPPAQCFQAMGACLPDAGTCSYAVRAGTCDDTLGCTQTDTCLADGGCTGTPLPCSTPPGACFATTGNCVEPGGTCLYAALPSGPCTDADNCTLNDGCEGDGGCRGAPVTCTAPGQCFAPTGACEVDGGCLFAPRTGQVCDGGTGAGTCSAGGSCVLAPVLFPYVPSNFTESDLPPTAGALTFDCGTTTLNTQAADGGIAWTGLCASITPAPEFRLVTVGTQQAVLLFGTSLLVPATHTLRVTGARPLILAVSGTATIGGDVNATSTLDTTRGGGANVDCGAAGVGGLGGNGGAVNNRSGGGGGGAFGLDGADGAAGNGGGAGGLKGIALGVRALVPLRGGCSGGNGGRSSTNDGTGGFGGGALQISSAGALSLTGTGRISASGGGGRGGSETNGGGEGIGGGGGGSGGGVLLEGLTLSLVLTGSITANGGGAGEGGGVTTNGDDGANGSLSLGSQALGGFTGGCGGNGGSGGALLGAAGAGSAETCSTSGGGSGGGGGGGVGRIRLNAVTSCSLFGTVSPAASGNGTSGCPAP